MAHMVQGLPPGAPRRLHGLHKAHSQALHVLVTKRHPPHAPGAPKGHGLGCKAWEKRGEHDGLLTALGRAQAHNDLDLPLQMGA